MAVAVQRQRRRLVSQHVLQAFDVRPGLVAEVHARSSVRSEDQLRRVVLVNDKWSNDWETFVRDLEGPLVGLDSAVGERDIEGHGPVGFPHVSSFPRGRYRKTRAVRKQRLINTSLCLGNN